MSDDISETVDGIISCVKQMRCIVDDVLDLHKVETGNMEMRYEPTNLIALLQSISLQVPKSTKDVIFCIDNQLDHQKEASSSSSSSSSLSSSSLPSSSLLLSAASLSSSSSFVYMLDPTRLTQVLLNLIGNSLKFTSSGSVTLRVSLVSSSSSPTFTDTIQFQIIDTGIGIKPENISKLFQPYMKISSNSYKGTGLGKSELHLIENASSKQ